MIKNFISVILILIFVYAGAGYGLTGSELFRMGTVGPNLVISEVYNGMTVAGMAALYNPAGMALNNQFDLGFKYGAMTFDRTLAQVYAGTFFKGIGGFGLTYLSTGLDGIESADAYGNDTGNKSYSDSAFVLSYGYSLLEDLDIGVNVKYSMSELAGVEASGIGFDVGCVYSLVNEGFFKDSKIQLALSDVYATKKWDTDTRYTSPLGIKLGLNLPLFYRRLLLSLDGESTAKFSKALFKTEN
ncbi:MAG: hypothetical protein PHF84_00800, partial [bacterium]|nr:hypothetical protein [bacterium]